MAIRYVITENNLKDGSYYARIVHGERVGLNQMTNHILTKTSLSPSDVQAVVLALKEEIANVLLAGNTAVLDGIASFNLSLKGSFDSPNAIVTNSNAQLNFNGQVEPAIIKRVRQEAAFSRQTSTVKVPNITSFHNMATNVSDQYTAGSIVRLRGEKMKFDPIDAEQGVFLNDGTQETRLTIYSTTSDTQIDALIPPHISGTQSVSVRTRYTTGGNIRIGYYQRQVTPST